MSSTTQLQAAVVEKREQGVTADRVTSVTDTKKNRFSFPGGTKSVNVEQTSRRAVKDYAPSSTSEQHDLDSVMHVPETVDIFHMKNVGDATQATFNKDSTAVVGGKNLAKVTVSTKDGATTGSGSFTSYVPESVMSTFSYMTTEIGHQLSAITYGSKSAPTSGPKPAKVSTVITTTGSGVGDRNTDDNSNKPVIVKRPPSTRPSDRDEAIPRPNTVRRQLIARGSIERHTRGLVLCLCDAKTPSSQLVRLEELCQHLLQYPDIIGIALKGKVLPCLLRLRQSRDRAVAARSREALSLIGYVNPVQGRGIRALCLDGGGTKGLVSVSIMKRLEELSQCPIHKLFDYVCGVSTGALIGIMAAVYRVPVAEMEDIYKEFSVQMFERNRLIGAGKLFMSHAYYDTELWERILKENIGLKTLSETARDARCPKFSAVSALVNVPRVQNFLFRNYNLPTTRQSHYVGSVNHHVWEAIRASSAAPGYYEESNLGEWVHQDGGLLTNNPTAIAIHECRLLWPGVPLQCVVSIGTGKYEPTLEPADSGGSTAGSFRSTSLKAKVTKIIESATDTEAVHTMLHDLLPASSYFRFNPHMSEDFQLDEVRAEKWEQMSHDTEMYCRKNSLQIEKSVARLLQPKPAYARAVDWLRLSLDKLA